MPIVKNPDAGSAGLIRDVPAWELSPPGWSSASNVRFRNGFVERAQGHLASYGTPNHAPYGIFPALDGAGNRYIVYPGLTAISSVQGTTHSNITRVSGGAYGASADGKWTGGVLNGIVIVNSGNGSDDPQFWTPQAGGNMAALTNWPASTKCRSLRPFKNYLFALDVTRSSTRYPYLVMWSAAATLGTLPAWTAAATNDAGETDLGDSQDYLVDALQIADQLAIYREQSIYLARYVGGTFVFQFARASNEAGMLANNCASPFPGGHVVLGPSDVYVFNGTAVQSIVDGRMRRWLFNAIDSTYYKRSFVVTNPNSQEVLICFPQTGATAPDTALVWNWKDNVFGVRDLPSATCAAFTQVDQNSPTTFDGAVGDFDSATGVFDTVPSLANTQVVFGTTASKLHVLGAAQTFDGTNMTAQAERTGISMGDAQRVKYVRSVWPRIDGAGTLEITIGTSMSPDEGYSWGAAQTYTVGTTRKVDVNSAGRYLGIRLRSSGSDAWRLRSFDVDVEPQGMW